MSWAKEELSGINLGDERLNKRAVKLLERFANQPTASIPGACGDWGETQGAYRFFSNDQVHWDGILSGHWKSSEARMAQHKVVLCIQDTTELDFNGQGIGGLGKLSYEARRGMYVHPTYAVSLDREPLGVIDSWMWARPLKGAQGEPIKESVRWVQGYETLLDIATRLPDTRLVYVADREGDIAELISKARDADNRVAWLIRAQHNRVLSSGQKLWDAVQSQPILGEVHFTIPSGHGRIARPVRQTVQASCTEIPDGQGGHIPISCILAQEIDCPEGFKPVQWRLISCLPVKDFDQALELIDWYRSRWEIELFFHVLKNGCKVEALQLSHVDKLERAIALFMVVAWRIGRLMRLGRTCPDMCAELLFDKQEWQAAYLLHKKKPPEKPPTLNETLRLIAKLGGFIGRKGDGEPGVKTIWLGFQRIADFVSGWRSAHELGWNMA